MTLVGTPEQEPVEGRSIQRHLRIVLVSSEPNYAYSFVRLRRRRIATYTLKLPHCLFCTRGVIFLNL